MGKLLWKKHYKYWRLFYVEGASFFAYKDEKAYVKDWEVRLLAVIKYRTYPDVERLKPCNNFKLLEQLGLINIRHNDSTGCYSKYCYFDITWAPYEQIPPLIIARTLIDGLGWRAFDVSIFDTWAEFLSRFDIIKWEWEALEKVLEDVPIKELPEFLTHGCLAIADAAGDIVAKRYTKSAYGY